jgi:hypothetical protein
MNKPVNHAAEAWREYVAIVSDCFGAPLSKIGESAQRG